LPANRGITATFPPIFQPLEGSSTGKEFPVQLLYGEHKMKKLFLALTLSTILSSAAIAAEMDFAVVDADGDSLVSTDEASAAGWDWTEEEFAAADADGDGFLNAEEFAAASNM
jgi:EF hand